VSDQERIGTGPSAARLNCPVCGHPYHAGDRFCAECGAALPTDTDTNTNTNTDTEQAPQLPRDQAGNGWAVPPSAPATPLSTQPAPMASPASDPAPESGGSFWVLGATPTTDIGGGILLLILAVILLFVGQLDNTGTIVMLSICVAPIALLVLLIGIVRVVAGAARRG
jgi:hypothetical protein